MTDNTPAQRDDTSGSTVWLPELLYAGGRFQRGLALVCDAAGRITRVTQDIEGARRIVRLRGRALLPGLVNTHSHAFQRVIRGRTEFRSTASADSFWTWREMMYSAAARLTPEDIYDASRMAFLEMLLGGITAVGEFHYLQHTPESTPYDDPNALAKTVVRAARDTGLRIALLRVAYARSGHRVPPNPRQARFIEPDAETYLRHTDDLRREIEAQEETASARAGVAGEEATAGGEADGGAASGMKPRETATFETATNEKAMGETAARGAWVGVAPHSVRAVPLEYLRAVCAFAAGERLPVHMHVAEQRAEVAACFEEHGRTPVALLDSEGLLDARFTAVHGVHVTPEEAHALARSRAIVCACPTTERNLGDGIIPADMLLQAGARVALGTDSHTQIDLLEDARELEYHMRLQRQERNVLAPTPDQKEDARQAHASPETKMSALASRLFECATVNGAAGIGATGGELARGRPADFFTVDLNDPSVAGASRQDLLPAILFSLARTAVREVVVGGRLVVEDGRHPASEKIVERFAALQRKLWSEI